MEQPVLCEDRNGSPIRRFDIVIRVRVATYSGAPAVQLFQACEMRADVLWVEEFPRVMYDDRHGRCVRPSDIVKWGQWVARKEGETPFQRDAKMILNEIQVLEKSALGRKEPG